jgi:group I intron endonuclease
MFVYLITNKVNGKVYVGQTTYADPDKRWSVHKALAKNGSDGCPKLLRAMRKHGIDSFTFEVLVSTSTQEDLDKFEIEFIEKYNSIKTGYNVKEGGSRGKHSDETKAKMSATRRANPDLCKTRLGDTASEETRKKMSETHKRIGNRPPAPTEEAQAKATAARHAKFKGKPRPWSADHLNPKFPAITYTPTTPNRVSVFFF